MSANKAPQARQQLEASDFDDPEKTRAAINDALSFIWLRLEALESTPGMLSLDVEFETGASVTPTAAPFVNGGVRVACPFTPTGLTLLRLQQTQPSASAVATGASDVKWSYATGPNGDGALIIDFVSGLSTNSRYSMRVGVTRA